MKYLKTILRNSTVASLILLIIGLQGVKAQKIHHPYSYYGIGELQENGNYQQASMGDVSLGWSDIFSISTLNPASYSNLRFTVFDLGIKTKIQNLQQNDLSYTSNFSSFQYFNLGFPLDTSIGWCAAIGLQPISKTGLRKSYYSFVDSFYAIESFDNSGSFNKFFIGTALRINKKIKLGFNFNYIFGQIENNHSLVFESYSDFFSLMKRSNKYYGNIGVDIGFQYTEQLGTNKSLTIAGIYSPVTQLKVSEELQSFTYEDFNSIQYFKDSLLVLKENKGTFALPDKYGFGFMFQKTKRYKDISIAHIRAGIDAIFISWSDFTDKDKKEKLNDQLQISSGIEFTPEYDINTSYLKRITYRFGIKYANSYLNINNERFNDMSSSLGFGFPVAKNMANLTLGFEIGNIKSGSALLIKENYCNIFLGIRFNDLWFKKPKID
jgi:hypothetical protein